MKMTLKKICHTGLSACFACILSWGGTCAGADVTYTYDGLNRVTKAEYGDGSHTGYFYDDTGNRTQKVCAGAVYRR